MVLEAESQDDNWEEKIPGKTVLEKLSTAEFDQLFIQGDRNLQQENFAVAVKIFEQLYQTVTPEHKQYFNIQRSLVKAYQQNQQLEQAIALCQRMLESDVPTTCLWGQNYMATLAPATYQEHLETKANPEVPAEVSAVNPTNPDVLSPRWKQKTLVEFKQYCQDHLLEHLQKLEEKRKETIRTIFISGIVCLILTWCFCQILASLIRVDNAFLFYLCCLSLPVSAWVIFCRGCIQVYGLGFKRNIIENIISFIGDNKLSYANHLFLENKRQTILAFTRSQIFQDELEEPDSLEQEDCVYGTLNETDIFFAEIFVENRKGSHLNELEMEDYSQKSLLFHGLFFEARFSKNFVSRTFIVPNSIKNIVKNKVTSFNNWRGEIIELEDLEFAQMFQVYGDSQLESRYILSTSLMSRLVEFNKKAKRQVYLSFVDGFLYIAIPYRQSLFEPKLWQSMMSFRPLKEYFQDSQLMIGIVEDLNLNRRIWR